jgi:hypothetical protein
MSYPFLGSLDLFIFFLVGPRCASKSNVVGVLSMLWVKWFVSGLCLGFSGLDCWMVLYDRSMLNKIK